jgi:hypothetical protein
MSPNAAVRGFRKSPSAFLLLLLLAAIAAKAHAQQSVVLGNAVAALTGPWKFHTGDNITWAQPDFDDSAWSTMDLTPTPGPNSPIPGSSGYVPGWTARGYKGTSGYAWYRLRVNLEDGRTALALKMPGNFDDAYQVYLNGQLIGEFGRFSAHDVTVYSALARAFPLPAEFRGGSMILAIRMYMLPSTPLVYANAGGLHGPPELGHAAAIAALLHLDRDARDRNFNSFFLEMAILVLALGVAFGLYWLDRTEPAYLWLGLTCQAILADLTFIVLPFYNTWLSGGLPFLLDAILTPVVIGLAILSWAYWFRLPWMGRLHRMVWGLVVLLGIGSAMLRMPLYGGVVPVHAIVWLAPLILILNLLLCALLVWVTVYGIRKDWREGLLVLPAVLLVSAAQALGALHLPANFFLFGNRIGLGQIATILSLLIISVLLLRRFLRAQREREQFRQEIEQARQLQQMLIPEALPHIAGLTIESEYRPALQVGGDFFQIIPESANGGVLIVVGDVTGHGLKAGMLVALIVGVIRNETTHTQDPLLVLQALNRTLCERRHAHATCLALRIASGGQATLANAGHLPPYLNGKELPMEGAMLLGMIEGVEFSVMHFQLQPGDVLMMMSDGIAEAQNEQGQLFGFERIGEMLRAATPQEPVSAAAMATAAQNFGQEDDISVLAITRSVNRASAIA